MWRSEARDFQGFSSLNMNQALDQDGSSLHTDAPCPKKNVGERDICGTQLTLAQHRRVALSLNFFEGRGYLYTGYRSSSAPMHGWQFVQLSHEPNARHAKAPFTLTRSGNGEERRGECNKLNANRIKWLQIKSNGDADGDGNEKVKKAIGLDWQNNNFAHASRFLFIFLPSLHDYYLNFDTVL